MKIFFLIIVFNFSSCKAENESGRSQNIHQVVETVLNEYQGLDFILCSKPLDYNLNSITTKGKALIEALDIDIIANFQEWTPTGNAVPIKNILNNEDLNYMKSQIISEFEWEKEKLSVKVESCQNNRSDIELKFSKPLFNKENNISLVFMEKASIADYSNSLILLKKVDGNWKIEWFLNM